MVETGGTRFTSVWRSITLLVLSFVNSAYGAQYSVAVDIGIQVTKRPCTETRESVVYSSNREYFFVYSERGLLDVDRVEDALRIYRTADIDRYLRATGVGPAPEPVWVVGRRNSAGPVILACRWLMNSQGIAFLQRMAGGNKALMVADLRGRKVVQLTPAGQSIDEYFDIHDLNHFVYRVPTTDANMRPGTTANQRGGDAATIAINGRSLASLLVPSDVAAAAESDDWTSETAHLWAATGGKPFEVSYNGRPVVVSNEPSLNLALSPDGREVATAVPRQSVPIEWEHLYPPPLGTYPHRIRGGTQDIHSYLGAHRYVRIVLGSGAIIPLTEGPTGFDAGWVSSNAANWSGDGKRIALTAAYSDHLSDGPQKPCVAVVDLQRHLTSCVLSLSSPSRETSRVEDVYFIPEAVEFVDGNSQRLKVVITDAHWSKRFLEFQWDDENMHWVEHAGRTARLKAEPRDNIWIEEDPNHAPLLMARRGRSSYILWDPNPQLKDITLGEVVVYHWRDAGGRRWTGGLYSPAARRPGEKYPLVIQTHGFIEGEFAPDGIFTTANAAQALANAEFFVLQVQDQPLCRWEGSNEAKCAVEGYDAAVRQLSERGDIDTQNVGIEGFSRTCLYVTEALVFGKTQYHAATITDGVMLSYQAYLAGLDNGSNWPQEANEFLGEPFGSGLEKWIQASPIFNLDRVKAPLQVVALGSASLLYMWEPYARLRYLHRPVDAIMLKTSEHLLTNPKSRLASQGGVVDWFRFWLKAEEDSDPEKQDQYARWHALRDRALSPDASLADDPN